MLAKKIILVGGGTRSGKSRFALSLAETMGQHRLLVVTAQAKDEEMAQRIRKHQESRGSRFSTLEVPQALTQVLSTITDRGVVVIDCLTFWLSNLLMAGNAPSAIERQVQDLCTILERRAFHVILVTSEVGLGIVPESALGRLFRDLAGSAHQHVSQCADEVYFALLGTLLQIKPQLAFIPSESRA